LQIHEICWSVTELLLANATDLSYGDSVDNCPQHVKEAIQDDMLEYFATWIVEEQIQLCFG
jgi:hypothetical protein